MPVSEADRATTCSPSIVGVLLAGGLGRRMGGGDKCLRPLVGRPLLAHVIDRLRPQVHRLVLNANGDPGRFAGFRLPIVADDVPDFAGPLAGILAGLEWAAREVPDCPIVLSSPTDAPFLPTDLADKLMAARVSSGADIIMAASNGRTHPVVALWPVELAGDLRLALLKEGVRKVDVWTARYRVAVVPFPVEGVDAFFNANGPEDLVEAEKMFFSCPKV
jgi:molybdenum cofactor guanylyltransferase